MRRLGRGLALAVLGSTALLCTPMPAQAAPPAGTWQLELADEFNGTALDTNIWNVAEQGDHSADQVTVAGGALLLSAREDGGWSTGAVSTGGADQGVALAPGSYLETRLRVPKGAAYRPAVRLTPAEPDDAPDRDTTTITALEVTGTPTAARLGLRTPDGPCSDAGAAACTATLPTPPELLAEGDHTIGLAWRDDRLDYYVDGDLVLSLTEQIPTGPLVLDLALDVDPGAGSSIDDEASLRVDYVRIYRAADPAHVQISA